MPKPSPGKLQQSTLSPIFEKSGYAMQDHGVYFVQTPEAPSIPRSAPQAGVTFSNSHSSTVKIIHNHYYTVNPSITIEQPVLPLLPPQTQPNKIPVRLPVAGAGALQDLNVNLNVHIGLPANQTPNRRGNAENRIRLTYFQKTALIQKVENGVARSLLTKPLKKNGPLRGVRRVPVEC